MLSLPNLAPLRACVGDALIVPGDFRYDSSRLIWNRLYDRKPAAIVRCASSADVIAAVRFAASREIGIAIKCGGHHAAGYASVESGLLLDLSGLRGIQVDPERRRVRAQAGLTWAHFDQVTQAFGLAATGPIVSTVGIAGSTLGGGVGWLHRKMGLGCDCLVSAEMVTAEGALITASEYENPDLYWGLRGSGWNFGVVTSMEYQTHTVGPPVVAGLIYFSLDQLSGLMDKYQLLLSDLPDELTTWLFLRLAPPAPLIPKELVGRPVIAVAMCHCGITDEGLAWAGRFAALGKPIANSVAAIEYRSWQRSLDARWGNGFYNDWRGHYLDRFSPATLDILADSVSRLKSPWTDIKIAHLEGAVGRVPESATAFGSRGARFALVIQARWEDPLESEAQIAWAKGLRDALTPYATGGAYTNFLAADETCRINAAHGPQNYRRLQDLKSKFDPANLFQINPNIPPIRPLGTTGKERHKKGN